MRARIISEMKNARTHSSRGIGTVGILALVATLAVAAVVGLGLAVWLTGGKIPLVTRPEGQERIRDKESLYGYVAFGPVLVNLAEGRLTRYLKISISLQVKKKSTETVKQIVTDSRKAVFRNWLIIYLSDLALEDVKGSSAVNRLRSDIVKGFNALLSKYCEARVEDVLFEEFSIQ